MGCLVCTIIDMLKPVDDKHKEELIEELRHDLKQYHPKKTHIGLSLEKVHTQLKREDFSYECNSRGYAINYKGQSIGGADVRTPVRILTRLQASNQKESYGKFAESAIQNILAGNPGRIFKEAIDKINKSEGV